MAINITSAHPANLGDLVVVGGKLTSRASMFFSGMATYHMEGVKQGIHFQGGDYAYMMWVDGQTVLESASVLGLSGSAAFGPCGYAGVNIGSLTLQPDKPVALLVDLHLIMKCVKENPQVFVHNCFHILCFILGLTLMYQTGSSSMPRRDRC